MFKCTERTTTLLECTQPRYYDLSHVYFKYIHPFERIHSQSRIEHWNTANSTEKTPQQQTIIITLIRNKNTLHLHAIFFSRFYLCPSLTHTDLFSSSCLVCCCCPFRMCVFFFRSFVCLLLLFTQRKNVFVVAKFCARVKWIQEKTEVFISSFVLYRNKNNENSYDLC